MSHNGISDANIGIITSLIRLASSRLWGKYFPIKDSVEAFVVSSMMLICGMVLDYFQSLTITLLGQKIYAQQILNLIGFVIILITVFYIKLHIETVKIDVNRKDGRA